MRNWPESYVEFLMRGEPREAMAASLTQLLTSTGPLGLVGYLALLAGIVFVLFSLGGKRSALFVGLLLGGVSVLLLTMTGYFGYASVRETLATKGAAITEWDTIDAANRVLAPILWTSAVFGGMLVLGVVSIFLGKRDA